MTAVAANTILQEDTVTNVLNKHIQNENTIHTGVQHPLKFDIEVQPTRWMQCNNFIEMFVAFDHGWVLLPELFYRGNEVFPFPVEFLVGKQA